MRTLFSRLWVPLGALLVLGLAYRGYGWGGVALASGALVMWALVQFSRMMRMLERAARQPLGVVDSAVMLHARLRPGATLVQVLGLTRTLGERQSPPDAQPEIFRWTDASQSAVTCTFANGRLQSWALVRPEGEEAQVAAPAP